MILHDFGYCLNVVADIQYIPLNMVIDHKTRFVNYTEQIINNNNTTLVKNKQKLTILYY